MTSTARGMPPAGATLRRARTLEPAARPAGRGPRGRAASRRLAPILVLALAACGMAGPSLEGSWRLSQGVHDGRPLAILDAAPVTLVIDGSEAGGRAACNSYGGTIRVDGSDVRIDALSMTEMACADDVMAAEAAYLEALPAVTTASVDAERLTLTGPGVELRFEAIPGAR